MFYDSNNVQLSTDVDDVTAEDTAAKYRAWHWNVIEIDGTDPVAICQAIETANAEQKRPTLIIGHTVMGKGCVTADGENFEGKCSTHGQPLSASGASYENTIKNLGGDPTNPWVIFDDVKALYESRKQQLSVIAAQRKEAHRLWAEANPELNDELEGFLAGKLPDIDYKAIAHKPNIATRASSADVLSVLGEKMHNIIVSSADLANSDKTDAFLKKTSAFRPGDFSGAFLHAGVSELTMAAIMNGIALHGGLRAACATFFVFSDYMKPVIRMSALMELPVVYIYTHDAFRVGEDGPTHQPIEQEAQMRLMEQIKNFSGKNSVLVLRPADSAETTIAWKMAIENQDSPTALILSRQNINDIPSVSGDRYNDALQMTRGGYVVKPCDNPDVILVGNGSEVSTLCDAAGIIAMKGIKARVVSVPSIGLFLDQDADYRKSVITPGVKTFGLTAGLPSTLVSVVGVDGTVFGLNHFGASASYKVLDEKFGFTPAAGADKIMNAIN